MHLVWDWNGTLLDDLNLVVAATNASLARVSGPAVSADEHRRDYRRPVAAYYAYVLGRPVGDEEFALLDKVFHDTYRAGLPGCGLAADARDALAAWPGTQSLLSMWFHGELVPLVDGLGLAERFARVDGLRATIGGERKAAHLTTHLDALGVAASDTVVIGDSLDDADAAAAVGAGCVLYAGGFTAVERLVATGLPVAHTLLDGIALATRAYQPGPAGVAGQPRR